MIGATTTPLRAGRDATQRRRLAGGRVWNVIFVGVLASAAVVACYACSALLAVVIWLG